MKVTSTRSVDFPKLGWGITAGDTRELPSDKAAQKIILAHRSISEVKSSIRGLQPDKICVDDALNS